MPRCVTSSVYLDNQRVEFSLFLQAISFAVAFFVGVTFLVVQYLAYKGLVQVNWDKISDLAVDTLDLNKDG